MAIFSKAGRKISIAQRVRDYIILYLCFEAIPGILIHFPYLNEYEKHPLAKLNTTLLWEYDLTRFDYSQMRNIVVQRVIERGWPDDWYAILNLYGEDGVKNAIKEIAYLNDKDMNFVHIAFEIPLTEMKCYERKQSRQTHWES